MVKFKANSVLSVYEGMVARGDILSDAHQAAILRELVKYTNDEVCWWKFWQKRSLQEKKGVYLYGDVGRGKSLVAGLFYDYCGIERKKRMHFNALMKNLQDSLHIVRCSNTPVNDQMIPTIDSLIGDAELLYLDEIQVRDICEAVMLRRLFQALLSRKMVVLMTSNYHPRKLYEDGVQRELFVPAIDLIEKKMDIIALQGQNDYRVAKSMKGECNFYIGANSNRELRERFLNMLDHNSPVKATFTLDHRHLVVGETYRQIAWFSFNELCGSVSPLWTADYRKIAESFSVVFIEGIPVFDQYLQNEMQRFIVLIDELYEHRTQLYCSMARRISEICIGKPATDLKRAMSRLSEMGSVLWSSK